MNRLAAAPPPAAPRTAAVAGLAFSLLMLISLVIMRLAVPDVATERVPVEHGVGRAVSLALHLIPFAGVAFLWLLGVLRDRIGALEDRFFGTVLLGSGLLFVASLFASAAVAGALVSSSSARSAVRISSEVYFFAREVSYAFMNIFAIKMAGVFMASACVIARRTAIFPRWIASIGYACSLTLLLVIWGWLWIVMLFPLWTLMVSIYFLAAKKLDAG
ncbi:hypothetical protein J8I87_29780 [Paraburkholderia sp. LEh10]|uniref:hypothetical protein n=1 Tax=Paraburkholderia sp. LEh10 TaxID=2821353 RepID=UPI001AEB150D|nr:hypothetical protein [Paraburkholderia sp. LEh10]MBP0593803.1 hypothetical protein [Paraburkholderia sp. LEh10]